MEGAERLTTNLFMLRGACLQNNRFGIRRPKDGWPKLDTILCLQLAFDLSENLRYVRSLCTNEERRLKILKANLNNSMGAHQNSIWGSTVRDFGGTI